MIKNYTEGNEKLKEVIDDVKNLSEMEPMEQSAIKDWLPKELKKYKRTAYSGGQMAAAKTTSLTSTFTHKDEETKTIELKIIDGAGSVASAVVAGFNRKIMGDQEEETEYSYTKTVEKKGYHALEEQNERSKTARLTFVENGRFLIELKGNNTPADELWDFAMALPLNKLK